MTTLCLAAACGPTVTGVGTEGESDSEDTGSTTDATNPTNPTTPTNPTNPTEPGTGDVTGDVTTNSTEPTATGPGDTTGDPPSDSCCEAHPTPTCDDREVVDCVCAREAFCCAFEWDENCVDLALNMCDATCDDPGSTTDEPTTTGTGEACTEDVTFELQPSDATHTGAWQLGMSMVGEGEISVLNGMMGIEGSILFEPDIPCDDTWYIWVRYWEDGQDDSYYATLDGEPMPAAVFEGDCGNGGQGYDWAPLNWRDEGDPPCTYVEDPWAPNWATGVHEIEFSYRESLAMGRILITNDMDLIPPP